MSPVTSSQVKHYWMDFAHTAYTGLAHLYIYQSHSVLVIMQITPCCPNVILLPHILTQHNSKTIGRIISKLHTYVSNTNAFII